MIERNLAPTLLNLAGKYPVVTVTGPRQSGKTTLCRAVFPSLRYVSLEPLDTREFARTDPRGFLRSVSEGAVIDEVQHVPELLSYLQGEVDERPDPGRFILTGSQQFALSQAVSQSLAGRTAVLELLPPSLDELRRFDNAPTDLWTTLWNGAYPRIFQADIPADRWLSDYERTYVERDVRQVLQVGDLVTFSRFLRLAAGRTGQELNTVALASDAGVSNHTARSWLSVLEASYLVFRLSAHHTNHRKQQVKAPKLHFFDSGLVCLLLGIRTPEQLVLHPLRGRVFESWVASELYKAATNAGEKPRLTHYRESRGAEVDLLVERAGGRVAVECKSGATLASDAFTGLRRYREVVDPDAEAVVVYGGDASQVRSEARAVAWRDVADERWVFGAQA